MDFMDLRFFELIIKITQLNSRLYVEHRAACIRRAHNADDVEG